MTLPVMRMFDHFSNFIHRAFFKIVLSNLIVHYSFVCIHNFIVFFLSLQHQLYMPLEPEFEMDDAFCEQRED
jgi:hypothetical protein